ncbi:S-layer homology domain-containing protein [Oscillibacter sp.]|uniref:S-layer homology domain-containing protein n=1 Tax=Oscillibacter sp. TaxID=1945593 RepID=UPI001B526E68|nr:S-layer homology domain-containing protein [Oscillibacter sp.]MBP3509091.1 S-layer homology domain-containing protein [Oscillibacter sp.]
MKKHIPLLLALCLLLTVPALAAEDSMENFVRSKTYDQQFSDLSADSVFYSNVSALYEYGLSVGKPDGTFGLKDSLTVGQAVIFAGRIRSLYRTGDPELGPAAYRTEGQATAVPYLLYLQAEGILGTELDGQLSSAATRAQMAHVLANLLPPEALPAINEELVSEGYATRRFITDVTEYTPCQQDILALYRTGVCAGVDAYGTFLPDSAITRGAAAAMLTRLADPALRVTLDWDLSYAYSAKGATLASLVEPGTYVASPAAAGEMDSAIRYMLSRGESTMTLRYPGLSAVKARQVMQQALSTVKLYCEQGYNSVSCSYSLAGDMTLTFSAAGVGDWIQEYRTSAMEAAIEVHDQLWANRQITSGMTELEKARVYYTWVCENTAYDYQAGDDSISHTPYSLFELGTAVCDGYTGAYNLLLKLEGIDCTALSNNSHIWTVATLDGTAYHIDTTWGDSGPAINYSYFAMTEEQSRAEHPW